GAYVTARPIRVGPRPDQDAVPPGARDIQAQRDKDVAMRERAMRARESGDAAGDAEEAKIKEAMMKEAMTQKDAAAKQRGFVPPQPWARTTWSVRSAPDGTFVVGGTEIGTYILSVNCPGFIPPPQQTVDSPSSGVTFSLSPNARIVGRVVDDETHKPVAMF